MKRRMFIATMLLAGSGFCAFWLKRQIQLPLNAPGDGGPNLIGLISLWGVFAAGSIAAAIAFFIILHALFFRKVEDEGSTNKVS